MKHKLLILLALCYCVSANAQFMTREDSLNAGLNPSSKNVILSGYGEAKYSYDNNFKTATANLTRAILFMGYRFNPKITFFAEMELEDAKVDGDGGEFSVEQCVLKFDLNPNNYLLAGLMIPRIGMLNENHLPTTFNGNDRHAVEQMVIPATWREIGVGYYGSSNRIAGLNWSLAVTNGLNGEGLNGGRGLRDARYEGRDASAANIGTWASLLYFAGDFRIQGSAYYGGSTGVTPRTADSLRLESGTFGTPVFLGEMNVIWRHKGFTAKALGAYVSVPDAGKLNTAYASNTPETMFGYFGELGYDLLSSTKWKNKQLIAFARYESMDLMASVPENGVKDDIFNQQYIVAGLTYLPVRGVAIKLDWKHITTGEPNEALIINPNPNYPAYQNQNDFYQLGLAYSF
ncbi:MAG: hypothetical protein U0Y08_08245 [Bacteroidia bacterium]